MFPDHSAQLGYGGGINIEDGIVTIKNNNITSNSSYRGGGINIFNGTIIISGNTISNNSITWGCGAGISFGNGSINISNNNINDNFTQSSGAGICLLAGSGIINNNTINNNSTGTYNGGGIFVGASNYEIKNNTISNNRANTFGLGGGIYIDVPGQGTIITGNQFTGNYASSYRGGAGIYIGSHQTSVTGNSFFENSTDGMGGGILAYYASSTIIDGNILMQNYAKTHGSAIGMFDAIDTQGQNNIIAQNTGAMEAVYISGIINVTMNNWTIANNGNYGIVNDRATVNIKNSIFSGHSAGGLYGSGITSTNSLFFQNALRCSGGAVCNNNIIGDPKYFDPVNGDFHITASSAAMNSGVSAGVIVDIDGESRPFGLGYDVGADEMSILLEAGFTNTVTRWAGSEIHFTNTSIASGIPTFYWDFGDGTTSTEIDPSHTYTEPGIYTISLSATNRAGTDTTSSTVSIDYGANFNTSSPDYLGETTLFSNATVTSGSTTYSWDFGDGTTSTENNPSHTYTTPGAYTVKLSAANSDGSGTSEGNVIVYGKPTPSFSSSQPDWLGQKTSFTGSVSTNPLGDSSFTTTWDFGDGTNISGTLTPEHQYSAPGTYQVKLTVVNAAGSNTFQNEIVVQAPTVQFSNATILANEGGGSATISINLDRASKSQVDINYSTSNGTALGGSDFEITQGILSFNPGQISKTFTIQIVDDLVSEPGETVLMVISAPENAVLGSTTNSVLTIQDNDAPSLSELGPTSAIAGSSEIISGYLWIRFPSIYIYRPMEWNRITNHIY